MRLVFNVTSIHLCEIGFIPGLSTTVSFNPDLSTRVNLSKRFSLNSVQCKVHSII